eukprot:TRINITY_DN1819_c1_g1_i1.p1 TRINITY_DN1819_c1_g1~~TRINITY_DN1819_c1_g1_i1.p1  ORF type:complete len:379 (+),score=80.76 TRINITY_DN1819_c1_g1_i1:100-1236(+)
MAAADEPGQQRKRRRRSPGSPEEVYFPHLPSGGRFTERMFTPPEGPQDFGLNHFAEPPTPPRPAEPPDYALELEAARELLSQEQRRVAELREQLDEERQEKAELARELEEKTEEARRLSAALKQGREREAAPERESAEKGPQRQAAAQRSPAPEPGSCGAPPQPQPPPAPQQGSQAQPPAARQGKPLPVVPQIVTATTRPAQPSPPAASATQLNPGTSAPPRRPSTFEAAPLPQAAAGAGAGSTGAAQGGQETVLPVLGAKYEARYEGQWWPVTVQKVDLPRRTCQVEWDGTDTLTEALPFALLRRPQGTAAGAASEPALAASTTCATSWARRPPASAPAPAPAPAAGPAPGGAGSGQPAVVGNGKPTVNGEPHSIRL